MDFGAKWEYLRAIHGRYRQATRAEKGRILDEFCRVTGYHRKYALRRLNGPPPGPEPPRRRRRGGTYAPEVIQALRTIWEAAGYPWSVRLKARFRCGCPGRAAGYACRARSASRCGASVRGRSTVAWRPSKRQLTVHRYGRTKPGALLKHHNPPKTDRWDVTVPDFTELDLVAHGGDRADGEFAHCSTSPTFTPRGWRRAPCSGGPKCPWPQALEEIRQGLPFRLRGIDADNGSEFINTHLYGYCQAQAIQFTRGRPYKKDDNAHIEQKHWTHVRKLVGYLRYDTPAAVAALNALYRGELRLLQNLFLPSVKLARKERIGARRRRYDPPRTPLERVQAGPDADPAVVGQLLTLRDRLDPFALAAAIDEKLERLAGLATPARRAPDAAARIAAPPRGPRRVSSPWHGHRFTFGRHPRRPLDRPAPVTS